MLRWRCARGARGGPRGSGRAALVQSSATSISNSLSAVLAPQEPCRGKHRPPPPRRSTALRWSLLQVEQAQPVEEKKGKPKASGKRFEIKKWNAVAM